jgi:hypothetical protein
MRLSDVETRIENIVRAKIAEVADRWFWGSAGSGSGARGADGRTLFAYWQADLRTYEKIAPAMSALRDELESLARVAEVRVRDFEPDTAYSGEAVIGEQWEIHLAADVAGPRRVAAR